MGMLCRIKNYIKINYCNKISNCCNSKMVYKYRDFESNYTCLKCKKDSYFKFRLNFKKLFKLTN